MPVIDYDVPTGVIMPYSGNSIPNGFLICDGSGLNTLQFFTLHQTIGYTYGGSGSTFYLPYLYGRYIRGHGEAGRSLGSFQGHSTADGEYDYIDDSFRNISLSSTGTAHQHRTTFHADEVSSSKPSPTATYVYVHDNEQAAPLVYKYTDSINADGHDGRHGHTVSGGDSETRPKTFEMFYIIKY
jgi:microcystin-dependent protein